MSKQENLKPYSDEVRVVIITIIIIIIFLHGLGRLTCSGIDALPSFPGASTISSSSRFVVEDVFRESGVVHSFKVVVPVLFVFESQVLYSRDKSRNKIENMYRIVYFEVRVLSRRHLDEKTTWLTTVFLNLIRRSLAEDLVKHYGKKLFIFSSIFVISRCKIL